jgi:hypothetical protein
VEAEALPASPAALPRSSSAPAEVPERREAPPAPLIRGGKYEQGPPDFAGEPLSEPDGESELGSPWSRMLEGSVEPGRGRIGHDAVRQDRLRELLSREPLLRQAVEALDLELLD